MRHQWEDVRRTLGTWLESRKRVCKLCGAEQSHECISYDRLVGSSYAWRPRVGRCTGSRTISDRFAWGPKVPMSVSENDEI